MEEFEITWEVSAIETLRLIYSKTKNKYGTKKADKLRMDIVSKAEVLRQMPTKHPLEPALYHLPQKFRFIKQSDYKLIYQVVDTKQQVIIVAIFHTKQDPKRLKETFK